MTRAGLQEGGTESGKTPEPGKQSWPGDWASVGDHIIREGGKVREPSPRWNLQAVATAGRGAGAIREGSG